MRDVRNDRSGLPLELTAQRTAILTTDTLTKSACISLDDTKGRVEVRKQIMSSRLVSSDQQQRFVSDEQAEMGRRRILPISQAHSEAGDPQPENQN